MRFILILLWGVYVYCKDLIPSLRIIGGEEMNKDSHPFLVYIIHRDLSKPKCQKPTITVSQSNTSTPSVISETVNYTPSSAVPDSDHPNPSSVVPEPDNFNPSTATPSSTNYDSSTTAPEIIDSSTSVAIPEAANYNVSSNPQDTDLYSSDAIPEASNEIDQQSESDSENENENETDQESDPEDENEIDQQLESDLEAEIDHQIGKDSEVEVNQQSESKNENEIVNESDSANETVDNSSSENQMDHRLDSDPENEFDDKLDLENKTDDQLESDLENEINNKSDSENEINNKPGSENETDYNTILDYPEKVTSGPDNKNQYYTSTEEPSKPDCSKAAQCGGALISSNVVVTAAHCIKTNNTNNYNISGMVHDISKEAINKNRIFLYPVNFFIPSNYNNKGYNDDIGIIIVRPQPGAVLSHFLTLDSHNIANEAASLTVAGWGFDNINGTATKVPKQLPIVIIDQFVCKKELTQQFNNVCHFCARGITDKTTSCRGDSGGPVYTSDNIFVGVVSYGDAQCSKISSAYTRIGYFYNWIISINNTVDFYLSQNYTSVDHVPVGNLNMTGHKDENLEVYSSEDDLNNDHGQQETLISNEQNLQPNHDNEFEPFTPSYGTDSSIYGLKNMESYLYQELNRFGDFFHHLFPGYGQLNEASDEPDHDTNLSHSPVY